MPRLRRRGRERLDPWRRGLGTRGALASSNRSVEFARGRRGVGAGGKEEGGVCGGCSYVVCQSRGWGGRGRIPNSGFLGVLFCARLVADWDFFQSACFVVRG